jgi:hypothetical protein
MSCREFPLSSLRMKLAETGKILLNEFVGLYGKKEARPE